MSSKDPPKKISKPVENKQATLLLWVKPCTSDPEPGVVEETIRIKEQPGNENDLEPSTTIAGRQEATKRQLSPPDQVFVNVSDSPYQSKNFKFPAKTFGSKNPTKRSFQTAWFERFKWLQYDQRRDAAYCHTYLKALQSGMLTSPNSDSAFTKKGFSNWKNAMEKKKGFQKHESSDSHMEAIAGYVTALSAIYHLNGLH